MLVQANVTSQQHRPGIPALQHASMPSSYDAASARHNSLHNQQPMLIQQASLPNSRVGGTIDLTPDSPRPRAATPQVEVLGLGAAHSDIVPDSRQADNSDMALGLASDGLVNAAHTKATNSVGKPSGSVVGVASCLHAVGQNGHDGLLAGVG